MLSRDDIAFYETHGYLMVEDVISAAMLDEMRRVTYDLIDRSRNVTESDEIYDLDRGHGPETPRLTRIKLPTRVHERSDRVPRSTRVGTTTSLSSCQRSTPRLGASPVSS